MENNSSDGKSDKNDGGQAHPSDTKQGKPSDILKGSSVRPTFRRAAPQYRSDRILLLTSNANPLQREMANETGVKTGSCISNNEYIKRQFD